MIPQAFSPESFKYCFSDGRSSGFPQSKAAFPSRTGRDSGKVAFNMKGLQLRVQLRLFTGFPIISLENQSAVKIGFIFFNFFNEIKNQKD